METIRIYGPGCANCQRLHQMVLKTVNEMAVEVTIQKVEDMDSMIQAGIMRTPALEIDGEVVLQGKLPTETTLKNWIQERIKT